MFTTKNATNAIRPYAAADAVIITVMACCCIFAASKGLRSSRPDRVVVFRQNSIIAEYPLANDMAFTVSGKNGPLNIEIKNGMARIIHSECPKKICKQSGGICGSHEQLICPPNNILIEVRSSNEEFDIDGIAY